MTNKKINHYQFPRPAYQAADVEAYLDALPKGLYAGLFNR
jgi:hypothetical protein